jgi:serine protease Do
MRLAIRPELLCAVVLLTCAACAPDTRAQSQSQSASQSTAQRRVAENQVDARRAGVGAQLPDFAGLVAEHGDAVVNVEVVQQRTVRAQGQRPDDSLLEFFRRFGMPAPELGPRGQPAPTRGAGSGFIVSRDGYVLTNAHVVADASEVTVRLTDRREFSAKVIGTDARSDVALLKIDAPEQLPTVRIGDASQLRTGQWVLAIGSPFGLENTATAGIVSATARSVPGGSYVPFIQTDVAVNPGNSGGPLFNLQGEVIGINSMIFSQTGGYMGLSFAVPIDVAIDVRDQLLKNGRVVRGRIGITVQDVNAQLAKAFKMDRPRGALVSSVEKDSPAARAGIQPGDVIVAVGDHEIQHYGEVSGMVARMKPGTRTQVSVLRNAERRTLEVRVDEFAEQSGAAPGRTPDAGPATQLGMSVRPLTSEEKRQAETEGSIVVEAVTGAAAAAGVQPGDVVLGVNNKRVASVSELRDAVKGSSGDTVALLIEREGAQIFVPLPVG